MLPCLLDDYHSGLSLVFPFLHCLWTLMFFPCCQGLSAVQIFPGILLLLRLEKNIKLLLSQRYGSRILAPNVKSCLITYQKVVQFDVTKCPFAVLTGWCNCCCLMHLLLYFCILPTTPPTSHLLCYLCSPAWCPVSVDIFFFAS